MSRRQWYAATTIDNVASYEAFLAAYADTDLAPTARRLLERAKNRMQLASTSNTCPCALIPGGSAPQPIQQQQQKPHRPEQKATRSIDKKLAMNKEEKVAKKGKRPPKGEDDSEPADELMQRAIQRAYDR